jgi:hypothetical protein
MSVNSHNHINDSIIYDSSAERLKKTSYFFSDGSPKQLLPSYG